MNLEVSLVMLFIHIVRIEIVGFYTKYKSVYLCLQQIKYFGYVVLKILLINNTSVLVVSDSERLK